MERRSRSLFVAMTGAQGTGKSTLAASLKEPLTALVGREIHIVEGVARKLKAMGVTIDKDATVESKWKIEAAYNDVEFELRNVPKLFCRSVVDRFAYARAGGLNMEMHFDRIIRRYVEDYDLLIYIPIEARVPLVGDGVRNTDLEFQKKVDEEIRKIIVDYKLPCQVVMGSVEERTTLALESIKLRLGGRKL